MCRIAAYLGPPAPLSALLYDPPHSMERQAYAPREMINGHVNVDGTGVAWWPESGDAEPLRLVTERTPWGDPNLPYLAPRVRGALQLHSVRSATPGIPVGPGNVHPFVRGRVAFVHNGFLGGFRERTGRPLLERLPDELWARKDAVSDSLTIFLTLLRHLDEGADLAGATLAALREAGEVCRATGDPAVLNALVADGERLVAARGAVNAEPNTLYRATDTAALPGATVVASEPLDDDAAWRPVPDATLLELTRDGVREAPLLAPLET